MIKKAVLFLLAALIAVMMFSCGAADDSEIMSSFSELAPKATQLFKIVYGDGLAYGEIGEDGYAPVLDSAAYTTAAELEEAMFEVFTPEYVQVLSNTAFSGVSSDQGKINPKFKEVNGHLYVDPSVTADFGEIRDFDISDAYVSKKNRQMAKVYVHHEEGDIEVELELTDDGWRIDSPLF